MNRELREEGTRGCWEDLDEGSGGELPAAPQGPGDAEGEERELQMRPEVGREGGSGC